MKLSKHSSGKITEDYSAICDGYFRKSSQSERRGSRRFGEQWPSGPYGEATGTYVVEKAGRCGLRRSSAISQFDLCPSSAGPGQAS